MKNRDAIWIYRHKLVTGIVAGALILFGAGLTSHHPDKAAVQGASVTVAPTVTPIFIPTATPTATPLPSLTPTAAATPIPVQSSQNVPAYSTDDSFPAGATAKCSDGTYSFSQV
jgi:hypothetical protein